MNIYRLFKFHTVGSVSQYGTLQQILSNASSLYMTHLAGKEPNNFQKVWKLVELKLHYYNLIWLAFTNKSQPPADKCILKVTSDHTKNINIYLNLL